MVKNVFFILGLNTIDKQLKKDDVWKATPSFIEDFVTLYTICFLLCLERLY